MQFVHSAAWLAAWKLREHFKLCFSVSPPCSYSFLHQELWVFMCCCTHICGFKKCIFLTPERWWVQTYSTSSSIFSSVDNGGTGLNSLIFCHTIRESAASNLPVLNGCIPYPREFLRLVNNPPCTSPQKVFFICLKRQNRTDLALGRNPKLESDRHS